VLLLAEDVLVALPARFRRSELGNLKLSLELKRLGFFSLSDARFLSTYPWALSSAACRSRLGWWRGRGVDFVIPL
jgi:hypothetical protein